MRFITSFIVDNGYSPSMDEIAVALGVSDTRAKQLVHKLATRKAIERKAGSQRGISVPGLFNQLVKDELRRKGMKVDEDFVAGTFPKGQLPVMPPFEHMPADWAENDDDDDGE